MIADSFAALPAGPFDVCIVGAGATGLALAWSLGSSGLRVLVLEAGGLRPDARAQRQAAAEVDGGAHHVPVEIAVRRQFGGTSNLWAGRCVPLDPIDFEPRPWPGRIGWPITEAEAHRFLPEACAFAGCGPADFNSPVWDDDREQDFSAAGLERWSEQPRLRKANRPAFEHSGTMHCLLRARATGFDFAADGRVRAVRVRTADATVRTVSARAVVLAASGLGNTRLLLGTRVDHGESFGGEEGPLGRFYMGHASGSVADITLATPELDDALDFHRGPGGTFVRRRLSPSAEAQRRYGLTNVALWPSMPPIADPAHRSGPLSAGYLALSIPPLGRLIVAEAIRCRFVRTDTPRRWAHLGNVLRDLPGVARFVFGYAWRRMVLRNHYPGLFQRQPNRRYALAYHAEHLPRSDSRVTLASTRDEDGVPRLRIGQRFTEADAEPLVHTHLLLERWLHDRRLGRLDWTVPPDRAAADIAEQFDDGRHQIGTTRMADSPAQGVVDRDCRVFGAANLFVAGSSVFVSSGQANPTLSAIALALRLGDYLTRQIAGAEAPEAVAQNA